MEAGTTAIIGKLNEEGLLRAIRVEYGGEPEYTGAILKACYTEEEKIDRLIDSGAVYLLRENIDLEKLDFVFISDEVKKRLYDRAGCTLPMKMFNELINGYWCSTNDFIEVHANPEIEVGSKDKLEHLIALLLNVDYIYIYSQDKCWETFDKDGRHITIYDEAAIEKLKEDGIITGRKTCDLEAYLKYIEEYDLESQLTMKYTFIDKCMELAGENDLIDIKKVKRRLLEQDWFPKEGGWVGEMCFTNENIDSSIELIGYLKLIKNKLHSCKKYSLDYNALWLNDISLGANKYCDAQIFIEKNRTNRYSVELFISPYKKIKNIGGMQVVI